MISCDYLIIGAGQTGLEIASKLIENDKKVILVGMDGVGGTYLKTKEFPRSLLLRSAKQFESSLNILKKFKNTYTKLLDYRTSLSKKITKEVAQQIKKTEKELKSNTNFQLIEGEARFTSQHLVEVNSTKERHIIEYKKCVIATGKAFFRDDYNIEGLGKIKKIITPEEVYLLKKDPEILGIIGLSYNNLQIAHLYSNLGYKVKIFEKKSVRKVLPQFDRTALNYTLKKLLSKQVEIFFNFEIVKATNSRKYIKIISSNKKEEKISHLHTPVKKIFEDTLDLNKVGIESSDAGIKTDLYGRCVCKRKTIKNIFALGDCNSSVKKNNKFSLNNNFLAEQDVLQLAGESVKFIKSLGSFGVLIGVKPPVYKIDTLSPVISIGMSDLVAISKYGPQIKTKVEKSVSVEGFAKVVYKDTDKKIVGISLVGEYASRLGGISTKAVENNDNYQNYLNFIKTYLSI